MLATMFSWLLKVPDCTHLQIFILPLLIIKKPTDLQQTIFSPLLTASYENSRFELSHSAYRLSLLLCLWWSALRATTRLTQCFLLLFVMLSLNSTSTSRSDRSAPAKPPSAMSSDSVSTSAELSPELRVSILPAVHCTPAFVLFIISFIIIL